jgi:hypothetical protein
MFQAEPVFNAAEPHMQQIGLRPRVSAAIFQIWLQAKPR